jgi:hypothetical protein
MKRNNLTGDKYTIVAGYKIFAGEDTAGEPIDAPRELHLYAWLRCGGYSEEQAQRIIKEVNEKGLVKISLP